MVETYTTIEELIIGEIKKRRYFTFGEKELNLMYNDIKIYHEITDKSFLGGIQALVDKQFLNFRISESGIQFYQLGDKLKTQLEID